MKRFFLHLLTLAIVFSLSGIPSSEADEVVTTLKDFIESVDSHAENLDTEFSVHCSPELISLLQEPSHVESDQILMGDIFLNSGCYSYAYAVYPDSIQFSSLEYYSGIRLFHSYLYQQYDSLSPREKEALTIALMIAGESKGTPLEKERFIHDALCRRITYFTSASDTGHSDNDSAIGALVDGRADCDGYSDAMMLCCRLAAIPARFVHGKSIKSPETDSGDLQALTQADSSHMWNLIKINDQWVMTDVTWDDADSQIIYLFFNQGSGNASLLYQWDPDLLPVSVAFQTDNSFRLPDFYRTSVSSSEEIFQAATQASLAHSERVCLDFDSYLPEKEALHSIFSRAGLRSYRYTDAVSSVELFEIEYPDSLTFCSSDAEFFATISDYADQDIHSFSLYFTPEYAAILFTENHEHLQNLLTQSRLAETSYGYNLDSCSISLQDVSFIDPLPICERREDLTEFIPPLLANHPESVTFALSESLTYDEIQADLTETLFGNGVTSYSVQMYGKRITLVDIRY